MPGPESCSSRNSDGGPGPQTLTREQQAQFTGSTLQCHANLVPDASASGASPLLHGHLSPDKRQTQTQTAHTCFCIYWVIKKQAALTGSTAYLSKAFFHPWLEYTLHYRRENGSVPLLIVTTKMKFA